MYGTFIENNLVFLQSVPRDDNNSLCHSGYSRSIISVSLCLELHLLLSSCIHPSYLCQFYSVFFLVHHICIFFPLAFQTIATFRVYGSFAMYIIQLLHPSCRWNTNFIKFPVTKCFFLHTFVEAHAFCHAYSQKKWAQTLTFTFLPNFELIPCFVTFRCKTSFHT